MASFRFTKLKITAGYTMLLAILLFSLVFVPVSNTHLNLTTNRID